MLPETLVDTTSVTGVKEQVAWSDCRLLNLPLQRSQPAVR